MAFRKIDWTQGVAIDPTKLSASLISKHDQLRDLFEQTKELKGEIETEITAWLVKNHTKLPADVRAKLPVPSASTEYKYHYRGGITVVAAPKAKARAVAGNAIAMR